MNQLIFDKSVPGRRAFLLPRPGRAETAGDLPIPASLRAAEPPQLPEVGELDVIRHFTALSQQLQR